MKTQLLDMKQYEKLTGKSYKQLRSMRDKGEGRWVKQGRKWMIEIREGDVVPGIDNESLPQPELEMSTDPAGQADDPGNEPRVDGDKNYWATRKTRADALWRERQNDNFLFRILNQYLEIFSRITIDGLRPLQQYLQELELPAETVEEINRLLSNFEEEFEENGWAETQKMFDELISI